MADRLYVAGNTLRYMRYLDDYPVALLVDNWQDTGPEPEKVFVVQTSTRVIERCILMTTDPGDLVLDPTCGGGTTAYCSEKWGRRWITCDTSRVALFLARQRLMTGTFPYFRLAHDDKGVGGGFVYQTVPHITMESISKNPKLDPRNLDLLRQEIRSRSAAISSNEMAKQVKEQVRNIIEKNAAQEVLFDKPNFVPGITRVSGPFTVEAIPVPVVVDPDETTALDPTMPEGRVGNPAADYVDQLVELMRKDGLTLTGGKKIKLENLTPLKASSVLHAEGEVRQNGDLAKAAISFGPQYGPVTVKQVEEAIDGAR
jgi:adenine-specific DNA-methyltransferase